MSQALSGSGTRQPIQAKPALTIFVHQNGAGRPSDTARSGAVIGIELVLSREAILLSDYELSKPAVARPCIATK
jgi:hypothetical protein